MKKIVLVLFIFFVITEAHAQNIGIGTTTPNTKALLDISSTTKGVLFPRMTTSQRLAITTVPAGLMVYDTDKNEYYHYNGSTWRTILNSEYWSRPITSRNRIANTVDSVGIGTSSPTEWLDVDGNIRSRNNIIADNNISVTGNIGAGSISTGGNIIVAGTSLLYGDITTNGDIIVNNSGATLQLRNGSNVNTGFFQLSGDNVRLGTNSGNSTGNMIIRMNGTDRVFVDEVGNMGIGDATPTHKLDVNGDINLTGELRKFSQTGTASLTPYCYGFIRANGTILSGTPNFTVEKVETGVFRIHCAGVSLTNTVVVAMSSPKDRSVAGSADTDFIQIFTTDLSGEFADCFFQFIAFKL